MGIYKYSSFLTCFGGINQWADNINNLFNCPSFYGYLSEQDAIAVLNDGEGFHVNTQVEYYFTSHVNAFINTLITG